MNINDKVVCVDDSPLQNPEKKSIPLGHVMKGTVYVVNGAIPNDADPFFSVMLVGLPVIWLPTGTEIGWDPRRFRELEEVQQENREREVVHVHQHQPCTA